MAGESINQGLRIRKFKPNFSLLRTSSTTLSSETVPNSRGTPFLSCCTVQALRKENVEFSLIAAHLKAKLWQKF